ncbi:MAG: hypothetical protein K5860_02450 [Bacteroidales bacterium]|nr:hypothetical protein [Bacteroidales bacterium]
MTRRSKLSSDTIELFEQIESFCYPLLCPRYNNLGDLHNTLEVEITNELEDDRTHIERISIADIKARIKELKDEAETIERANDALFKKMQDTTDYNLRNQLERQTKHFQGYSELQSLESVLQQHSNKPDDYVVEIECPYHRSGYYTRTGKDAKIVLEYNFGAEFFSTYIHEMMHAFYDSERLGSSSNSIEYVEEPLAEYGMLRFLSAFVQGDQEHRNLLEQAIRMVNEKQYTLGLSHYAFGEYLYQNYSHIEWEKLLLAAKNKVDVYSMEYKSLQAIFQTRPDKSKYDKAAQLLYDILAKANGNPSVKIAKQTSKSTTRRKAASPNDSNVPFNIDKATYDIWLKRYQESGILPSVEEMDKAMGSSLTPSTVSKTTDPSKVIVEYQEPYDSFRASYTVHLEYDYSTDELRYLIKDFLRGLTKKLTDSQIKTIKAYLKNRQNVEDFFQKAHDTAPIRTSHIIYHKLFIKYGARSNSVSNGKLMPWAEPFAALCD